MDFASVAIFSIANYMLLVYIRQGRRTVGEATSVIVKTLALSMRFCYIFIVEACPGKSANYDFPCPIKYNRLYSHPHLANLVSWLQQKQEQS